MADFGLSLIDVGQTKSSSACVRGGFLATTWAEVSAGLATTWALLVRARPDCVPSKSGSSWPGSDNILGDFGLKFGLGAVSGAN